MLGLMEAISDILSPIIGNLLHALLLVWLVYRGSTHTNANFGKLLICMSVCPMIRIVGFAISSSMFPGVWYYSITEAIVILAACFAVITNGYTLSDIGLCIGKQVWITPLILFSGIMGGWMESHIIAPSPLVSGLAWHNIWFVSLMLIFFTGFGEEFIFRGVIQHAASVAYRPWMGIVFTAVLWALLHIGWLSWIELAFVCFMGLLWGTLRHFSRSIISLSLAHGIANIMLFVAMPYLHK